MRYYTRASAASDDENQGWISNDLKWQKGRWQSCRSPIQVLMRPPLAAGGVTTSSDIRPAGLGPPGSLEAWNVGFPEY